MGNSGRIAEMTDTYLVETSSKIGNSRITMSKLSTQVKQKQQSLRRGDIESGKQGKYREVFKNESGAIDLASIMVGIIVIGLIGGVIAATVFAVIPWSQDNAAKHQLDSIVAAQSAYMGLASDSPPALPTGHKANSFANSASLASANLLQSGSTYCTTVSADGKSYEGLSQSSSGKVWSVTDTKTKPTDRGIGSIAPNCSFTVGIAPDGDGSEIETPYVDPTPTTTILTYKCDSLTKGKMPLGGAVVGTAYWFDGTSTDTIIHNNNISAEVSLLAGKTYTFTFEGTYETFYGRQLNACLRSVDHWGSGTGVVNANSAFHDAKNLISVPEHIPTTITSADFMFAAATIINDPNISKWDVGNMESMSNAFHSANSFNQPLNEWEVSNLKNASGMFMNTKIFNQPLDKWEVSNVNNMTNMFYGALAFTQDLSRWDVLKVASRASFADSSPLKAKISFLPKFQ